MRYTVQIKSSALKAIGKLPRAVQVRVRGRIDALAEDPRPAGAIKLAGGDDFWRIRVGDWRVIYVIQDRLLLVLVVRVAHRREAYRER